MHPKVRHSIWATNYEHPKASKGIPFGTKHFTISLQWLSTTIKNVIGTVQYVILEIHDMWTRERELCFYYK